MKQTGKNTTLYKILIGLLAVLWMVVIFIDHQVHNTYYIKAINHFQHGGLLLVLLLVFFVGLLFMNKGFGKSKLQLKSYSGWMVALLWLIMTVITFSGVAIQGDHLSDPARGIAYFTGHVLVLALALMAVVVSAFAWGHLLLRLVKFPIAGVSRTFTAIAIGFGLLGVLMFFLATLGFYQQAALIVLLIVPVPLTIQAIGKFFHNTFMQKLDGPALPLLSLFALFLILLFTGMNVIAMIRPMPIGFDASNLYLNIPHLLSDKGALLEGGQAYNWSMVMGLGFSVFKSTPIALLLSILPGILSIFVVLRIARLIGVKRGGALTAAALVYALPVVTWQSTQEAKVDMALLFFGLSVVMLLLEWIRTASRQRFQLHHWWNLPAQQISMWVVIGLLAGFAIGIKFTSLFFIIGLVVTIFYQASGQRYGWLGLYLAMAVVFGLGLYKLTTIPISLGQAFQVAGILILVGTGILIYKQRTHKLSIALPLKPLVAFFLATFLVFLPWLGKNYLETHSSTLRILVTGQPLYPSIDPAEVNTSAYLRPSILEEYDFVKDYNPGLLAENKMHPSLAGNSDRSHLTNSAIDAIDNRIFSNRLLHPTGGGFAMTANNQQVQSDEEVNTQSTTKSVRKKQQLESGVYEEVARYLGYEPGLFKYLSVPYDLTMQINVPTFANGIGFILLMLLPLLVLRVPQDAKSAMTNVGKYAVLLVWLGISLFAAFLNSNTVEGAAFLQQLYSASPETSGLHGFHEAIFGGLFALGSLFEMLTNLTDSRLIFLIVGLLPLAGFAFYRHIFSSEEKPAKGLTVFAITFFMVWLLMGSGISWYGIVGVAVLLVLLIYWLEKGKGIFQLNWVKNMGFLAIGLWLILVLFVRLTVFNPNGTYSDEAQPLDRIFSKYASGEMNKEAVMHSKLGEYVPTLEVLNAPENKDYRILRFGTFMQYFIDQNNERVFIDNQLNVFKYLYDQSNGNASKLYQKLKKLDIRFIIFSTNIGGYTEENLMQQKAQAFQEFIRGLYKLEERPVRLIYPQNMQKGQRSGYFAYELLFEKL